MIVSSLASLSRYCREGMNIHIPLTLKSRCQRVVAYAGQGPVCPYRGGRDGYSRNLKGVGSAPIVDKLSYGFRLALQRWLRRSHQV